MDTRCWLKIPTIRHHPAPFFAVLIHKKKRNQNGKEHEIYFEEGADFMALAGIVIVVIIVAQVLHEIKAFE